MKKLLSAVSIVLALSACETTKSASETAVLTVKPIEEMQSPKNIIMVIADGMGPAYTTSYRYFNDDPLTEHIEETVFDRLLVGSASTYPARVSGVVTDSAAGATALATGFKTYNGAIALDVNKNSVYDSGVYLEKTQPERVSYYPDVLEIRASFDQIIDFTLLKN